LQALLFSTLIVAVTEMATKPAPFSIPAREARISIRHNCSVPGPMGDFPRPNVVAVYKSEWKPLSTAEGAAWLEVESPEFIAMLAQSRFVLRFFRP
jgi:hypothetical protein